MTRTPTAEQQEFVNASFAGAPVIVGQAGAGTGKTSVMELLANSWANYGVTGIYITLNRNVAHEVGSRFTAGNIYPMTIHALTRRIAQNIPSIAPLLERVDNPDMQVTKWKMAKQIKWVKGFTYDTYGSRFNAENKVDGLGGNQRKHFRPSDIVIRAYNTITAWCNSADTVIGPQHVAKPDNMHPSSFDEYTELVLDAAWSLWNDDLIQPDGRCTFSHDHYLKMVSLCKPNIVADYGELFNVRPGSLLLVDEGQDTRPSMMEIVKNQLNFMRIIIVGDSSQAIYGFTGARDALPEFSALDTAVTLPLTQSWRFGQAVADRANRVLDALDAVIRLRGNPSIDSTVETYRDGEDKPVTDAVLVRTNAALLEEVIFEQKRGRKVAAMTDTNAIIFAMEDIKRIRDGDRAKAGDLRDIDSYAQLLVVLKEGYLSSARTALLRLGVSTGPEAVIDTMSSCVDPSEADVTISTVHKAKGREWDSVRIAGDAADFIPGASSHSRESGDIDGELTDEGRDILMLYYVAVTRGKNAMFIPADTDAAMTDFENKVVSLRGSRPTE